MSPSGCSQPSWCRGEFMKIMHYIQESQPLQLSWRRELWFVLVAEWDIWHWLGTALKVKNIRSYLGWKGHLCGFPCSSLTTWSKERALFLIFGIGELSCCTQPGLLSPFLLGLIFKVVCWCWGQSTAEWRCRNQSPRQSVVEAMLVS